MTANISFKYSYVLNNPLRFTDPSGYMFEPKDPKGVAVNRSGEPIYQYLYYGPGRGDPGNIGWGNTLGESFYYLNNSRPPEAGPSSHDIFDWEYDGFSQTYINWSTGQTMDPYQASRTILPRYGYFYGAARTFEPNTIRFSLGLARDKGASAASDFIVSSNNQGFDAALDQYIFGITYHLAWKVMLNSPSTLFASNDGSGLPTVNGVTGPWSWDYALEKSLEVGSHPLTGLSFEFMEHVAGLKGFKYAGWGVSVIAGANDTYQFKTGKITAGRYGYRMGSTGLALGLSMVGSSAAPFIGPTTVFAEWAWDAIKFQYENIYLRVNSLNWWGNKYKYGH